jgi:LytS/YehU family sensor histidine kinase
MISLVGAFIVFQCTNRPNFARRGGFRPPKMEQRKDFPPKLDEFEDFRQRGPRNEEGPRMERRHTPPLFVGEHDVLSIVVLLLMFGANLGTKYYFRSRRDQRKLEDLEKQNLEQQLEYLKYQINPHFFMNTLNNIHALVDIDPLKAQETIRELSKMMRFVLYEGDKSGVPLTKEFEFIRNYTKLMQLRYSDKVNITVDVPEEAPDVTIPPLMLISFIENAFKHGISYQHDSFIDIKLSIKDNILCFDCRNSKAEKPNQEKGGVGLANVKKRLDLLYDKNYTLEIKDEPDIYIVELKLPLR